MHTKTNCEILNVAIVEYMLITFFGQLFVFVFKLYI